MTTAATTPSTTTTAPVRMDRARVHGRRSLARLAGEGADVKLRERIARHRAKELRAKRHKRSAEPKYFRVREDEDEEEGQF